MDFSSIMDFTTGVIIPVYCLWRSGKDRDLIISNINTAAADCKAFVEKCLRKENTEQLQEIKRYFQGEGKNKDAVKNVERIIELPKQSDDSLRIVNSYLESNDFYKKALYNFSS